MNKRLNIEGQRVNLAIWVGYVELCFKNTVYINHNLEQDGSIIL